MFNKVSILGVGAALLGLASANPRVGNYIVKNNCNHEVGVWEVGPVQGDPVYLAPGETYSHQFWARKDNGGVDIKVSSADRSEPNPLAGQHVVYAFHLASLRQLNYNLVNEHTGVSSDRVFPYVSLVQAGPEPRTCESIIWADGVRPSGSTGKSCTDVSRDFVLNVCKPVVERH